MRGLHFSFHVMLKICSKYLLGFSYKKTYIFRTNIKNSAKKSTGGSSCVNLPQNIPFVALDSLEIPFLSPEDVRESYLPFGDFVIANGIV